MPIIGWIRDLFGIHKDHIDKKRSKLEVKKLENEEHERSRLIKPATMADIEKYDPKYKRLRKEHEQGQRKGNISARDYDISDREKRLKKDNTGCLVSLLLALLLVAAFAILVTQQ